MLYISAIIFIFNINVQHVQLFIMWN